MARLLATVTNNFDDPLARGPTAGGGPYMSGVYRAPGRPGTVTAPATAAVSPAGPQRAPPASAPQQPAAQQPAASAPRPQFISAKDIRYDRPGSVASAYQWTPESVDKTYASIMKQGSKNSANIDKHYTGYLSRQGVTAETASGNQRVAALDYAFREESRKQQNKQGFFDSILGKVVGVALQVGATVVTGNPLAGAAVGATWAGAGGGNVLDIALGGVQGYGIGQATQWTMAGGIQRTVGSVTNAVTGAPAAGAGTVPSISAPGAWTVPTGNPAALTSAATIAQRAAAAGQTVTGYLNTAGSAAQLYGLLAGAGATGAIAGVGGALAPPGAPAPITPPPAPGPTMPVIDPAQREEERLRRRRRATKVNFTWGKQQDGLLATPELSAA